MEKQIFFRERELIPLPVRALICKESMCVHGDKENLMSCELVDCSEAN